MRKAARRESAKAWLASGGLDPDLAWVGGRLMFVVGYTSGGAPYGCYLDEMEDPW